MSNQAEERLYGMAEAERQIRVAQRLYAQTSPGTPWERLGIAQRRAYIDRACRGASANEME